MAVITCPASRSQCGSGFGTEHVALHMSRKRSAADAGYVTAETAMVLPVLALLLVAALWAVAVAGAQLRCVDAARDGARAAARGESDADAIAVAKVAAPDGADVELGRTADRVVVVVRARVGPAAGPLKAIPVPVAVATAVAELEDGS
jgi:Flp pilus assembly protein TadG